MTITNSNKIKIALLVLLIVALFTLSPLLNVFAYATETTVAFDNTNVLDDLRSSDDFNVYDYRQNTFNVEEMSMIRFVEYCYSPHANMRNCYGLYVYVYNPLGIEIDLSHDRNKIQIAVSYNGTTPIDYEKFDLEFCNYSTEPGLYQKLYKFKVVDHVSEIDGKTISERVQSTARRYDVSGIEIHKKGYLNATEYTIGGTYTYTGFAEGFGFDTNAKSTLSCEVYDLETIKIDLSGATDGVDKRTIWRSDSSSLGKWHQNQINTVFFAIDNDVLAKYGNNLQKIKAEWWEYKTVPVLVLEDDTLYNTVYDYRYTKLSDFSVVDYSVPFSVFNTDYTSNGNIVPNLYFDFVYNIADDTAVPGLYYPARFDNTKIISQLPWVFKTPTNVDVNDYTLTAENMMQYAEEYKNGLSIDSEFLNIGGVPYAKDLFESTVDTGRTMGYNVRIFDADEDTWDILSYNDTHSWWDRLLDYGFGGPSDESYLNQKPIYVVSDSDLTSNNLANTLLIDEADVDSFKAYYNKMKNTHTVFLFRYAMTDYYAQPATISIHNQSPFLYGEIRQGTEIFNFDIIEFTFGKEGNYTVIPAVSSPVDHWSDFTPAKDYGCNMDFLRLIIGLIIVLIIFIILWPILPYILKFLGWVITAPFKFIGWLIGLIKGDESTYKRTRRRKGKRR